MLDTIPYGSYFQHTLGSWVEYFCESVHHTKNGLASLGVKAKCVRYEVEQTTFIMENIYSYYLCINKFILYFCFIQYDMHSSLNLHNSQLLDVRIYI